MSAYESIHALDATVPAFDLPMRPRNAYLRILIWILLIFELIRFISTLPGMFYLRGLHAYPVNKSVFKILDEI